MKLKIIQTLYGAVTITRDPFNPIKHLASYAIRDSLAGTGDWPHEALADLANELREVAHAIEQLSKDVK